MAIHILLYILFAYTIASVPTGLIIVRLMKGVDIRTMGSGNIGATNTRRIAGTKAGLLVLGCDILKGLLPVLTVLAFHRPYPVWALSWMTGAVALAAVAGHIFPACLYFKPSGKGVATSLGAYLPLAPLACASALALFLALTCLTRRVSIGAMGAALILPVTVWLTGCEVGIVVSTVISVSLILLRHKDNIRRLLQDKEPKL